MEIKDSGDRTEFEVNGVKTGAVRDLHGEDKGRMDLVPLGVVGAIMSDSILINIDLYIRTGRKECLVDAFKEFVGKNYSDIHTAILEVSMHYRDGSQKYQERNWERGIKLSSYVDSMSRHYLKHLRHDKDEPHDRAFMWNLLGALWTHANMPEMIDLPFKDNAFNIGDDLEKTAKELDETKLNRLVSLWQKYHSEETE